MRLLSWKLEVTPPDTAKFVLVGAPHTSNWDFPFFLLLVYATGIKMHWLGKHSLFRGPFGPLMRWLGGIPVDRRSRNNFVAAMVQTFKQRERLVVAISPEGTRSLTRHWKTGFYYIAHGAGIPIALGFIDYAHRVIGIGPTLAPSGDIQADFEHIRAFYAGKVGKFPHLQGQVTLQTD